MKILFKQCFTLLLVALATVHQIASQDLARVRKTIETLCSPEFHGRGATFNGDSVATEFIKGKFQEYELKNFGSYFQTFHYNINTFPGKAEMISGKFTLVPGKDFIIHPSSGQGKKRLKLFFADTLMLTDPKKTEKLLAKNLKKYAVVLPENLLNHQKMNDLILEKILSSGAIIEVINKKLTASLSPQQYSLPYIQVRKEAAEKMKSKVSIDIDATLLENHSSDNVIGYIEAAVPTDSFIVISAHNDHLGRMGRDTYFPGANDNASGTSLLLELAAYYSSSEAKPEYNIAFMSFGAEEAGLIGSRYYTEHPFFPLSKIKFLINLDLMGTGDEGMMVVNGAIHTKEFDLLLHFNEENKLLPAIKKRGKAANSDHYFFSQKGVPSFFFYTLGGINAYHDIYDIPSTLPLTKYKEVFELINGFIKLL